MFEKFTLKNPFQTDPAMKTKERYQPIVQKVNQLEQSISSMTDEELRGQTEKFRQRLANGKESLDQLLPEAFATVREASKRVLGLRPFDVQVIGGVILHEGQIAEMRTGEGKTLVSALPAYLNALSGKGVHVVTVNDYLAKRDMEWIGQIHKFLGLSVGLIQANMSEQERRSGYSKDVTYVTNSELGFDYLRDNLAQVPEDLVLREFNFCIIDEVDSILIDEARTPLIISGVADKPSERYVQAAKIADAFQKSVHYTVDEKQKHDWGKMVTGIQDHIGSLNFGYRTALREKKVDYKNEYCSFVDANTVKGVNKRGVEKQYTFDKCVIAVGGRPSYLDVPGARELCITSDDVFSLENPPGKTLCVGASYISLETAGFLTALGYDTSVVVRSVFLRGFDAEIAKQIVGHMERHGTRMIRDTTPQKFEKTEDGKIKVEFKNTMFGNKFKEEFDTVVLAVGRDAVTEGLNLPAAGVEFNPKNGKIPCVDEQTNVSHIYAIGDVLDTRQELTPVAIKAGVRLAHRIFGDDGKPKLKMNYDLVPTTVFTPLEYGCVGMSEELAKETYGEENIESFLSYFKPLEWTVNHAAHDNGNMHREDNACFAKVVVNKADSDRVVGLHYLYLL